MQSSSEPQPARTGGAVADLGSAGWAAPYNHELVEIDWMKDQKGEMKMAKKREIKSHGERLASPSPPKTSFYICHCGGVSDGGFRSLTD